MVLSRSFRSRDLLLALSLLVPACHGLRTEYVAGDLIELNDNGGWCWFQDERVLVDRGTLIAGSVADDSGQGGAQRKGNVELSILDLATRRAERVVLHARLEDDDHNAPALLRLREGRYLAAYGKHGSDRLMRWRVSTHASNATQWQAEQRLNVGASYTYQNLHLLRDEGRIYNFHRGVGFNPNYAISNDDAKSFAYGGRLLAWDPDSGNGLGGAGRPYLRYKSNGRDRVHFVTTEDHPRNFDNSLYHAYVHAGQIHNSKGERIADLSKTRDASIEPTNCTRIYQGNADNVAWPVDLELDSLGQPVVVFSVQHGDSAVKNDRRAGGQELHYYYARFDGSSWHVSFLAHAGSRLYSPEVDYSGLAAIDPARPHVVVISTNSDPRSGEPLISRANGQRHYELFRGNSTDGGRTWTWTALTANSRCDNLRPVIPDASAATTQGRERTSIVCWMRGSYRTYRDFDTRLVATFLRD